MTITYLNLDNFITMVINNPIVIYTEIREKYY